MKNYKSLFFVFIMFYTNSSHSSHIQQSPNSAFRSVCVLGSLQQFETEKKEPVCPSQKEKKEAANIEYLARVEYYEQTVFERPLTEKEKDLYCGHLLEK